LHATLFKAVADSADADARWLRFVHADTTLQTSTWMQAQNFKICLSLYLSVDQLVVAVPAQSFVMANFAIIDA